MAEPANTLTVLENKAAAQVELRVTTESLIGVVKTQIRNQLDAALRKQVKVVNDIKKEIEQVEKDAKALQIGAPSAVVASMRTLAEAMRLFYPDVVSEIAVTWVLGNKEALMSPRIIKPAKEETYQQAEVLVHQLPCRSIPAPAEALALNQKKLDLDKAYTEANAEVVRLRGERGRLNEIAEDAASALTVQQMQNVQGGQQFLDTLERVQTEVQQRLALPALTVAK